MDRAKTAAVPKPVEPQTEQAASGPTKPTAEAPAPEAAGFEIEQDAPEATESVAGSAASESTQQEAGTAIADATGSEAEKDVTTATESDAESAASGVVDSGVDTAQTTSESDAERLDRWQNRLLPVMVSTVLTLSLFFFLASAIQLVFLHNKIWEGTKLGETGGDQMKQASLAIEAAEALKSPEHALAAYGFSELAKLEQYTVGRRYHQANVFLMSRVWVRYLGFVTGMILALVGATFILGKMREPQTETKTVLGTVEFSFAGTSPGIFLALVGVTLMLTTIVAHRTIEVNDAATYVNLEALSKFNMGPNSVQAVSAVEAKYQSTPCADLYQQIFRLIELYGTQGDPGSIEVAEGELNTRLERFVTDPNSRTILDSCPEIYEYAGIILDLGANRASSSAEDEN